MLDRFTYRQRNIGLLAVFLLSCLLVYQLALKQTVELAAACSAKETELETAQDAPQRIALLKAQRQAIENVLGDADHTMDFQQRLLETVSDFCRDQKLTLSDFPNAVAVVEKGYRIETNAVSVQGSFNKLVRLVYELEQKHHMGKIAAVEFATGRVSRNKPAILTATIYVQNVKKISNEA